MSTAGSSEGTFPVVVFFPGFACTTPASAYSTVLSHIASWGYVVIGMIVLVTCLNKPPILCPVSGPWALVYSPSATYRADWVDPVLAWARAHLASHLPSPDTVPDFDTIFLGAQSSGAHVAVNYLALREDQVNGEKCNSRCQF